MHADRCAPWHQKAVVNAVCYILQEQLSLPSFVTFILLTILHPALPLSYLAVKLPTVLAFLTHAEGKDWLGNVTERKRTLLRVGKFAPRSQ